MILGGRFWLSHDGERTVSGRLSLVPDGTSTLVVEVPLIELHHGTSVTRGGATEISVSGRPRDITADYVPHTLTGALDDGRLVTILDAYVSLESVFPWSDQSFKVGRVVLGCHASEDSYAACRFALSQSDLFLSALRGMDERHTESWRVSAEICDGETWLRFDPARSVTWRELQTQILAPTLTLFRLGSAQDVWVSALQVKSRPSDSWCDVCGQGVRRSASTQRSNLLTGGDITISAIAGWISNHGGVHHLAAGIAEIPGSIGLQTDLLKLAVIAEGLHTYIFRDSRSSIDVPKSNRAAISEAGSVAALKALKGTGWNGDFDAARKRFGQLLGGFSSVPYK